MLYLPSDRQLPVRAFFSGDIHRHTRKQEEVFVCRDTASSESFKPGFKHQIGVRQADELIVFLSCLEVLAELA
jgi:hypothetical protein